MKTIKNPTQPGKVFLINNSKPSIPDPMDQLETLLKQSMQSRMFAMTLKLIKDGFDGIDGITGESRGKKRFMNVEVKPNVSSFDFSNESQDNSVEYHEFLTVLNSLPVKVDSIRIGENYLFKG